MKRRIAYVGVAGLVLMGLGWWALRAVSPPRVVGEFFDSAGVRIHYTTQGPSDGEPVILVHGFAVNADYNWRNPGIVDRLAKRYRVVALDNRGHGLSGKPYAISAYGEEMARDVLRLMDHLKIERAHVVGYSMGAYITLKLLTMAPERLISAAPCGAGWQVPTAEDEALFARLAADLEAGRGFDALFDRLRPADEAENSMRVAAVNAVLGSMNDKRALSFVIRGFRGLTVAEAQLRANTVPVLSVVGSRDPLRKGVDNLIGVMGNHTAVFVEGGDHVNTMGRPELAEAIERHLAAHPRAVATAALPAAA